MILPKFLVHRSLQDHRMGVKVFPFIIQKRHCIMPNHVLLHLPIHDSWHLMMVMQHHSSCDLQSMQYPWIDRYYDTLSTWVSFVLHWQLQVKIISPDNEYCLMDLRKNGEMHNVSLYFILNVQHHHDVLDAMRMPILFGKMGNATFVKLEIHHHKHHYLHSRHDMEPSNMKSMDRM